MVNAGISFKFGQGNHVTNSRVAMAKELLALKDYVQKQDEKIEKLEALVASRDLSRSSAGAPAQGLFLSDVVYPPGVFRRGGGSGLFDGNEKSGMRWDK